MDGRELGIVARGNSLSVEVPAGGRSLSPDERHTIAIDLNANMPYYFDVPSDGKLDLVEPARR